MTADSAADVTSADVPAKVLNDGDAELPHILPGKALDSDDVSVAVEAIPVPPPPAPKSKPVSYFQLFRFCESLDIWLYIFGTIGSIGQGITFPLFTLIFAGLLNGFFASDIVTVINQYALYMLYIAIGTLVCGAMGLGCISWASERQGARIRKAYMRALMRAEVGYHDTSHSTEAVTRMTDDVGHVVRGIGEPLANTLQFGTQFIAGLIMGFVRGPALAAVVCAFLPLLALFAAGMKVYLGRAQKMETDAYARAGEVSSEAIANVRVVASYCGEEAEVARYSAHLGRAERVGIFKGLATGLSLGGVWFSILICYGVGLWFGSVQIANSRADNPACAYDPVLAGCVNGGTVINIFFAVIIAAFALAQAAPNITEFGKAQGSAETIFAVIDRKPAIDNLSAGGLAPAPSTVRGELEFRSVSFSYPSRRDAVVLRDFSLKVPAGTSLALVGPSGCGKSSVIALLQRWYDPDAGSITLDGVDLREYNVQWLRERMGLVLQDPVLFQGTVAENIALGLPGGGDRPRDAAALAALQPRIEAAARAANAHDFITTSLTHGYATSVGERGAQMSGGQRQRVSIARALIRDPRILLLDEATSALDTKSEAVVQAAIDRLLADKGADVPGGASRTSLCIAHRLSTIRDVDKIVVMEAGRITAAGTHAELMAQGGLYAVMSNQQRLSSPTAAPADAAAADDDATKPPRAAASTTAAAALPTPSSATTPVAAAPSSEQVAADVLCAVDDAVRQASSALNPATGHAVPSLVPSSIAADVADAAMSARFSTEPTPAASPAAAVDNADAVKVVAAGDGKKAMTAAEEQDDADGKLPAVPFSRVWAYQKAEAPHIALAVFCAIVAGASMPCFSIIFARVLTVFYNPDTAVMQQQALQYMGWFFLIGACSFLGQLGMWSLFAYAGEKLTRRLRVAAYRATLRCEIAYFDDARNTTGRITSRMAEQAALIKATTGERIVLGAQNVAALAAGVAIAFSASWQIALLVLAIFPLIAVVGMVQVKLLSGMTSTQQNAEAGNVVLEAMTSVRTVFAYGLQAGTLVRFADALRPVEILAARRSFTAGAAMGASFFTLFGAYGLVFWAGGQFINNGWTNFQNLLQSFFAIIMAAQGAGQAAGLATDQAKADRAKRAVFALIDRASAIDPLMEEAAGAPGVTAGDVEFRDCTFAYPSRPDHAVLRGLSLHIPAGAMCALVGPSGGGKSTLIALIQRYYDVANGAVLVDGVDVKTLAPKALRSAQALVPQMPALWSDSVEYNIAYGALPRDVPAPDVGTPVDAGPGAVVPASFVHSPAVEEAAKMANAHAFIASFPHGYATHCGAGGAGLSGGQRSRTAIARAVMRRPKVLLLDEATAALDSESERIVQAALDALIAGEAGAGMTKIVVAHRLATIRKADIIAVVSDGVVAELGTHAQLMAKVGGIYRGLALAQDPDALSKTV